MSSLPDESARQSLLRSFLAEDIGAGDITTAATVSAKQRARGELIAKTPLVLAGIDIFAEVFQLIEPEAKAEISCHDGEYLQPGQIPARITATARTLLTGERVALNLLQRLCGVATMTRKFVQAVAGTHAEILDTRKTTPGLRAFEKYAVQISGGRNHRKDLSEAILIKENHIRLAGGVAAALAAAQSAKSRAKWLEIEVTNLEELSVALQYNPDVIMLDNMNPALVPERLTRVRPPIRHENSHRGLRWNRASPTFANSPKPVWTGSP